MRIIKCLVYIALFTLCFRIRDSPNKNHQMFITLSFRFRVQVFTIYLLYTFSLLMIFERYLTMTIIKCLLHGILSFYEIHPSENHKVFNYMDVFSLTI